MPRAPLPVDYHERVPLEVGGYIRVTRIEEEYPPSLTLTILKGIWKRLRGAIWER